MSGRMSTSGGEGKTRIPTGSSALRVHPTARGAGPSAGQRGPQGARSSRKTKAVQSKLQMVDWDFREDHRRDAIHSIHPYPAKFIPPIPRELIRLFRPRDGMVILDPFCGSGTTLLEASTAGIPSVGIDLHPLAALITRVKTTPLTLEVAELGGEVAHKARRNPAEIPNIPRLDHWFKKDVQAALAALAAQIEAIGSAPAREALDVALSRIIVRVSNQESDTRYAAISKKVTGEDVFDLFERSVIIVGEALAEVRDSLGAPARVICSDILDVPDELIEPESVGLVVTSPPYPNAYEYWLYHKYRMYWLGMNPIAVRQREIGARPHYFKTCPQDEHDFERQMDSVFRLIARVLASDGYVCFLVGRSIIRGRRIDNVALLQRAATGHGLVIAGKVSRTIPRHRKTFNPDHGSIEDESLVVFARE